MQLESRMVAKSFRYLFRSFRSQHAVVRRAGQEHWADDALQGVPNVEALRAFCQDSEALQLAGGHRFRT